MDFVEPVRNTLIHSLEERWGRDWCIVYMTMDDEKVSQLIVLSTYSLDFKRRARRPLFGTR